MVRPPRGTPTPDAVPVPPGDDGRRVRDDFSFAALDYAQIGVLKRRAGKLGVAARKNQLLRAGIAALAALPEAELIEALQAGAVPAPRPAGEAKPRDKRKG